MMCSRAVARNALSRFLGHCIDAPLRYKKAPYSSLAKNHLISLKRLYAAVQDGDTVTEIRTAIVEYRLGARPFQLLLTAEACDDADIVARIVATVTMYEDYIG